ncbi:MAG: outer membrane protein assembly factor BamD [Rickettsiales bacterium]|jgi:outer membrane protein assembly factor BamD|nr:outer membrane protein assembly factor BamD [Rickettsiales bacterium]
MKKFLSLLVAAAMVSCTGKNGSDRTSGELLYTRAMENFKFNRVKSAIEDFEKLESNYDFAKYYEAMLMIAYAHYSIGDYDDALLKIDSIKKLNMDIENLQYVYYLEILNKYKKIGKSRRDLMMLKEVFYDIGMMLAIFPGSIYDDDLILKSKDVLEYLVESELNIAKFYIENNNFIGALNHLREITNKYPENIYSPEVSYLMYRLYSHIGYVEGKDLYRKLLEKKYADSKWFKKIGS